MSKNKKRKADMELTKETDYLINQINFLLDRLMEAATQGKTSFKILCPYHVDNEENPSMNIDLVVDEAHCDACQLKKSAVEVIGKAFRNNVMSKYYSRLRCDLFKVPVKIDKNDIIR